MGASRADVRAEMVADPWARRETWFDRAGYDYEAHKHLYYLIINEDLADIAAQIDEPVALVGLRPARKAWVRGLVRYPDLPLSRVARKIGHTKKLHYTIRDEHPDLFEYVVEHRGDIDLGGILNE